MSNTTCPDPLLAALENTNAWLADSRSAGTEPRDAARAMRVERANRVAQSEELFGIRRPR